MSETVPKTTHANVPCGAKESTTPRPYRQSPLAGTRRRGLHFLVAPSNVAREHPSLQIVPSSFATILPAEFTQPKARRRCCRRTREEDEVNAPPVLSRASISELVDRRGHLYRHGAPSSKSKACVGGETGRRARSGARNRGGISPQRSTGLPEFAPAPFLGSRRWAVSCVGGGFWAASARRVLG